MNTPLFFCVIRSHSNRTSKIIEQIKDFVNGFTNIQPAKPCYNSLLFTSALGHALGQTGIYSPINKTRSQKNINLSFGKFSFTLIFPFLNYTLHKVIGFSRGGYKNKLPNRQNIPVFVRKTINFLSKTGESLNPISPRLLVSLDLGLLIKGVVGYVK